MSAVWAHEVLQDQKEQPACHVDFQPTLWLGISTGMFVSILLATANLNDPPVFLASGTHWVTLHTPPKGDLFAAFHSDGPSPSSTTPGPASTATPPTPMTGTHMGMFNPYPYIPPWFMPSGMPTYPVTPTLQPGQSHHHDATPSSDPPDDVGANCYPEIQVFFAMLDQKHPRCNLLKYVNNFELMDFYHIDKIAKVSIECLSSAEFGVTAGNAQFISNAIKADIKHIDHILGKKHM